MTLNQRTRVAHVSPLYHDEAPAAQANGPKAGKTVNLALTDPDSSEVVPWAAPKYAGDFMLDSQGDQELIFDHVAGRHQHLTALHLPASVDDSAWATTRHGALYVTDGTDDTVDVVSGEVHRGDHVLVGDAVRLQQRARHLPWPRLPRQLPGHHQHADRRAHPGAARRPGPAHREHDLRPR